MRFKIIGTIAIAALIAACETGPEGAATTGGTGVAAGAGAVVPGSADDFVYNVGDRVFFDFDKFNLRPPARETLDRQAAWLKKFPESSITIEGHCDERGTREYNLALGERRANAAKEYLVALGIEPNRVKTISYGKERPVCLASNESCWQQNRRSVTVVKAAGT